MEELRSTDILDKEIISDAEKKAERILLKAQEEAKRIEASVESRVNEEISKTEETLKLKLNNIERDLNASIPLEKSRFYVSFVQDSIIKNINEYLSGVSEEKIISLLCLKAAEVDFSDKNLKAFVYGLDEGKVENILKNKFGNKLVEVNKTDFNKILYEESFLSVNKGIILVSDDEDIKCRFTLCQVVSELLNKYRAELAESLFGKQA